MSGIQRLLCTDFQLYKTFPLLVPGRKNKIWRGGLTALAGIFEQLTSSVVTMEFMMLKESPELTVFLFSLGFQTVFFFSLSSFLFLFFR